MTLQEIANSTGVAIDPSLTQTLVTQQGLGQPTLAFFPPLDSTREGDTIIADRFQQTDNMAVTASQFVDDATTRRPRSARRRPTTPARRTTSSASRPSSTASRSTPARRTSLMQVFTDVKAAGGSTTEAVQFSIEAALNSAQFLYRSEIGDASKKTADGIPLTPYEMATQLSFFLSDGPPDAPLLAAAAANQLSTPAQIGTQVDRLLGTPAVQANLSFAMFVFFKLHLLDNVVIDPAKVPRDGVQRRRRERDVHRGADVPERRALERQGRRPDPVDLDLREYRPREQHLHGRASGGRDPEQLRQGQPARRPARRA